VLSVAEAITELRSSVSPLQAIESIPLIQAVGRVLASEIQADLDVPPADNSAMDGYALRHADWPGHDLPLPISQRIAAGSAPAALQPGTAARIFTGAEIPAGANTVIMQENCDALEAGVVIRKLPDAGANVRPRGQDIRHGQVVLQPGKRLQGPELGLLASLGLAEVPVVRRLKVAIISNGDELVEPGEAVAPGQIYNSNRYLLQGILAAWGFEVIDLGIAPDDPGRIGELLETAAAESDVILSSGGVSVGEEDHIKTVVANLGSIDLWKIAIKPGKPLAFGQVRGTPFIGLPGNPASVLVTCLIVARPFLFDCQGIADPNLVPVRAKALFDKRGSFREEYLRARHTHSGIELYPNQSSGVLLSSTWGDGLAVQALGQDIASGDPVDFIPYANLR
jgi:molybdopterin molybdotransferase